jgi:L-rhamnose isomerase/sugar isomerase
MRINQQHIQELNQPKIDGHQQSFNFLKDQLEKRNVDIYDIIQKLKLFQIAIPSWALGQGGTRFGRFSIGGEPRNLQEKIQDIGLLHALNGSSGAVSLHIPWDIPENVKEIKSLAESLNIKFDAVNSNTFQDQENQEYSYKYGSLSHTNAEVRKHAIDHNIEVIRHGEALGSKSLTVWLSDGSCFPGQQNFKKAFERTLDSLSQIYDALPENWKVFVEYKPFEPAFYSTVINDWGTSFLLANKLGDKAYTLVDLGHHLPNTNIEQIVALLILQGKLGGFHFNDSKFADDDLTVGSIKPYQLFLIFNELVEGMHFSDNELDLGWMIDASHNVKDPLEDLLQSVEAIKLAYAQALIIDRDMLWEVQDSNDVVKAQEIMQDAFRTDVRPLLAEARLQLEAALDPLGVYRSLDVRNQLIKERGLKTVSTGL